MARKCTEYHYFQHTFQEAITRDAWTRCPHCGKLCKPSEFKGQLVLMLIGYAIVIAFVFLHDSVSAVIGWFATWLLFLLVLFLSAYVYVRFFMPYVTVSEDDMYEMRQKFRNFKDWNI